MSEVTKSGFRATIVVSRTHIGSAFWSLDKWDETVGPVRAIRSRRVKGLENFLEEFHSTSFACEVGPIKKVTIYDWADTEFIDGAVRCYCWYVSAKLIHHIEKLPDQERAERRVRRVLGDRECDRPYNEFRGIMWQAVYLGLKLKRIL